MAWVIALELALPWLLADLGALATSGGPAIAVLLSSSAVFSAWCCAAASTRSSGSCSRPTGSAWPRRRSPRWSPARSLAFRASSAALDLVWGVGAVVAVLAAGILTSEAARAPAAAKDRMNLPRIFRREPNESLKGIRERSAVVRSAELAMPAFREPVTREQAVAALERSRARRAAARGAQPGATGSS